MNAPPGCKLPDGADAGLAAGLYLVSVPIGNARDITLRALDILAGVEVIACEDTRSFRRLAGIHGISLRGRQLVSYHDRSPPRVLARLCADLAAGRRVAYAPEAGTALVSDPGHRLVASAVSAGVPVIPIPGPSAHLAAMVASGLPPDRFLFAGFPPSRRGPRRRFLGELASVPATLVFYEAPHRLAASLADMAEILGNRPAALAREITKVFEEIRRGRLEDFVADPGKSRGEHVIVVGPPDETAISETDIEDAVRLRAADGCSARDAARALAEETGLPRREAYQRILAARHR